MYIIATNITNMDHKMSCGQTIMYKLLWSQWMQIKFLITCLAANYGLTDGRLPISACRTELYKSWTCLRQYFTVGLEIRVNNVYCICKTMSRLWRTERARYIPWVEPLKNQPNKDRGRWQTPHIKMILFYLISYSHISIQICFKWR